jgi:hypothetical protein
MPAATADAEDPNPLAAITSADTRSTADVTNSFLTLATSAQVGSDPRTDRGALADPVAVAIDAYRRLAELAARASYAPDPCTADDAVEAEHLEATVRAGLRSANARRSVIRV